MVAALEKLLSAFSILFMSAIFSFILLLKIKGGRFTNH